MRQLPDNFVDLTVTSPPYDNLRTYNGFAWNFEETAQELFRITKNGRAVVWVVSDGTVDGGETGTSFRQALYFMKIGFKLHDTMIWRKPNPTPQFPSIKRYTNDFEYMFVFSKGKMECFNPLMTECKLAGRGCNRNKNALFYGQTADRPRDEVTIVKDTKRLTNTWEIGVGSKNKVHPAVFPEKLAANHILSWSNPGDLIFDPFLGSGTTATMAVANRRNFLGFDMSDEYCKLAKDRVNQYIVNNNLQETYKMIA